MYTETHTTNQQGGYWASVAYTVPSSWVRSIASSLWSSELSDRTWTKWKKVVFGNNFRGHKTMHKEEAKMFFAYAFLRRKEPYAKITQAQLKVALDNPEFNRMLESVLINCHAQSISGFDIPFFIEKYVGRTVSYSTLYFWGKLHPSLKFSKHRKYTPKEVEKWVDVASKYA